MKICLNCHKEFTPDRHHYKFCCENCAKEVRQEQARKNAKINYKKNKSSYIKYFKEYNKTHKEYFKEYYQIHKEEFKIKRCLKGITENGNT